jgi:carbamoyl-phosphate synthase large subunit
MNPRSRAVRPWPPRPRLSHRQAGATGRGLHPGRVPNDITRETMASFEPTIDTGGQDSALDPCKISRHQGRVTSSMRSVGETMAIGRTFCEALQKGLRSWNSAATACTATAAIRWTAGRSGSPKSSGPKSGRPTPSASFYLAAALRHGMTMGRLRDHRHRPLVPSAFPEYGRLRQPLRDAGQVLCPGTRPTRGSGDLLWKPSATVFRRSVAHMWGVAEDQVRSRGPSWRVPLLQR